MKRHKLYFNLVVLISLGFIIVSCNQEVAPSLYQEQSKGNTPIIGSVTPSNQALAGVSEVTINGSNFSSNKEENTVYFGTAKATVLEASATKLVVRTPTLVKSNIDLKVSVKGVENFSNIIKYTLIEAVGLYYTFAKGIEDPITVTVDKNENVLVYVKDQGTKKIGTDGKMSSWAPRGAESFFFDMKIGPNNVLYGTRNLRAIFYTEEGKMSATYVTFPTGIVITFLDFDENKNIWAGGSGGNFYSVTPAKVSTAFPIDYTISSIRVYNGYLYIAGKNNTEEAIYRYKINSNSSLGNKEKYFDIGAKYGLNKVTVGAITFTVDGELIIGTDQPDAFIKVTSDGTASPFYPGVISPSVKSLCWGTANNLFFIREYEDAGSLMHTLVRVDMQKLGAPYYGR